MEETPYPASQNPQPTLNGETVLQELGQRSPDRPEGTKREQAW